MFTNSSKFILPPLDSARQLENEQQSTVGEVSQLLEVMALASRLAGPENAVPVFRGSDIELSKKKRKKFRSLFLHVLLKSRHILDVVGTFWIWSSTTSITVAHRARCSTNLFDCVTCAIYSRRDHCTRQASGMTYDIDVMETWPEICDRFMI